MGSSSRGEDSTGTEGSVVRLGADDLYHVEVQVEQVRYESIKKHGICSSAGERTCSGKISLDHSVRSPQMQPASSAPT